MHLFYADESGSISDPTQRFFVLAGLAVFERETHWIEQDLNQIASRCEPKNPHAIELHVRQCEVEVTGGSSIRETKENKPCLMRLR